MIYLNRVFLFLWAILIFVSCGSGENSRATTTEHTGSEATDSVSVSPIDNFASEYEDPDRSSWQKPDSVLLKFGNLEGKNIADIGAGAGYFTLRLATKGAFVLAIDIEQNFLEHIEEQALRIPREITGTIETRITVPESPSLKEKEVEGALIVNTAYFLPDRTNYFKAIFIGLKKGGRLIVVDFKPERTPVAPPDNLWISSGELVNEIKSAGFTIKEVDVKTLPYQYIITAIKQ